MLYNYIIKPNIYYIYSNFFLSDLKFKNTYSIIPFILFLLFKKIKM